MSSVDLDHEVARLLAKYGKNALINALAKKIGLTSQELEAVLKEPPGKGPSLRTRRCAATDDPIAVVSRENPAKARLLRTLHDRFQNRTFLPELRDVRRFFERHSRNPETARSRSRSLPQLIELLAELDLAELDFLCRSDAPCAYSSLGIIAEEILRPQK